MQDPPKWRLNNLVNSTKTTNLMAPPAKVLETCQVSANLVPLQDQRPSTFNFRAHRFSMRLRWASRTKKWLKLGWILCSNLIIRREDSKLDLNLRKFSMDTIMWRLTDRVDLWIEWRALDPSLIWLRTSTSKAPGAEDSRRGSSTRQSDSITAGFQTRCQVIKINQELLGALRWTCQLSQ